MQCQQRGADFKRLSTARQVILDTLMVREFTPGWISLDITAAVEEWRKR